jgi:hypothetical protein
MILLKSVWRGPFVVAVCRVLSLPADIAALCAEYWVCLQILLHYVQSIESACRYCCIMCRVLSLPADIAALCAKYSVCLQILLHYVQIIQSACRYCCIMCRCSAVTPYGISADIFTHVGALETSLLPSPSQQTTALPSGNSNWPNGA